MTNYEPSDGIYLVQLSPPTYITEFDMGTNDYEVVAHKSVSDWTLIKDVASGITGYKLPDDIFDKHNDDAIYIGKDGQELQNRYNALYIPANFSHDFDYNDQNQNKLFIYDEGRKVRLPSLTGYSEPMVLLLNTRQYLNMKFNFGLINDML